MEKLSTDASRKIIGGTDYKRIYTWNSTSKQCQGFNVTYDKHGNYDQMIYLGNYAPSYCGYR